jgi:15-cis-phytoene synthase
MSETLKSPANDSTPFDSARATARAGAPDRYVAALLAPRAVRDDLIVLAAFSAEIEKIPLQVSEPHLGEIRIQWWRDALLSSQPQTKTGHPIADAFADTIQRHDLPQSHISDHLDAAVHGLYADAPADDQQLALELDMKEGVLFALAAHILGGKPVDPATAVIHDAAQAYGLTRLALTLPFALARGRTPFPPLLAPANDPPNWNAAITNVAAAARRHLAHVRAAYSAQPTAIKTALLPLALVEPYLRALSHASHDSARDLADITPLTRAWCIGKSHMRARL